MVVYAICIFSILGLLGLVVWQYLEKKKLHRLFVEEKEVLENELFVRREMEAMVQQFTSELQQAKEELEISNQKLLESERELKLANATKDQFFSILAHDLRSPLGSLMNLAQLLHMQYDTQDDHRRKEFIGMMLSASQQVYALLENLLQWARSQSDRIQLFPVFVEVEEIFNGNKQLLENLAEEKGISIKIEVPNGLALKGDKNMLNTAIRNLLSNAIKFTRENGCVCLRAFPMDNGKVCMEVEDNGVGMSEEVKNNLFDDKKSTTSRGTRNETGTGLGLLVCKEFIERHEGEILVDSVVGKGTTFRLMLPQNVTQ